MTRKTRGRIVVTAALLFAAGAGMTLWKGRWAATARAGARLAMNQNTEVEVLRDIPYRTADGHKLVLDIFRPKGVKGPMPGIVMIHGGSWNSGSKEQVQAVAEPMAKQGYVVANINYRLAPASKWPAQIEDSKAAVRWLRRNAKEYGVNPARIGAVGFSAGAQLAALLGTTTDDEYRDGDAADVSSTVQAVIAVSGPFDFYRWKEKDPDSPFLSYYLGGTFREKPEAYRAASPVLHVTKDSPPFLLIDGAEDSLVLPENDDLMATALRKAGVQAEILRVKNAGHVLQPAGDKKPDPPLPVIMLKVAAFLDANLR
jgi:acetyl esterase/lipase